LAIFGHRTKKRLAFLSARYEIFLEIWGNAIQSNRAMQMHRLLLFEVELFMMSTRSAKS
jgi:hypothetical protein